MFGTLLIHPQLRLGQEEVPRLGLDALPPHPRSVCEFAAQIRLDGSHCGIDDLEIITEAVLLAEIVNPEQSDGCCHDDVLLVHNEVLDDGHAFFVLSKSLREVVAVDVSVRIVATQVGIHFANRISDDNLPPSEEGDHGDDLRARIGGPTDLNLIEEAQRHCH